MNQSEQIDKLVEALAKAQGAIQNPQKNKRVKVGESYEFEYADLTAIIDAVKQPLSENGLAYTQTLGPDDQKLYRLTTRLLHSSGQWISSETPLFVDTGKSQAFGSALTFMKRYALAALLGVAADSDDDANAADGNTAKVQDKPARKPKEPAPSVVAPNVVIDNMLKERTGIGITPHAIPVPMPDGKPVDWISWGQQFIVAAQCSDTPFTADNWLKANQDALQTIKVEAPRVHKRLTDALAGVYPQGLENKTA